MRIIRWIIYLLFILALICYFMVSTSYGLRAVVSIAKVFLPGKLQVQHVDGALKSNFHVEQLSYQSQQFSVFAKSLNIDWQPLALWQHQLQVKYVAAEDVQIKTQTATNTAPEGSTPSTHKDMGFLDRIFIHEAKLKSVSYQIDTQQPIRIQALDWHAENHVYDFLLVSNSGKASGKINFNFAPALEWHGKITASDINPEFFMPKWRGLMNADIITQGRWDDNTQSMTVSIQHLTGELKALPIDGFATLNYSNGNYTLKETQFKIGDSKLNLAGSLNPIWDLQWELSLPNLKSLDEKYAGQIFSRGRIYGDNEAPKISGNLNAKNVMTPYGQVQTIKGDLVTKSANQFVTDLTLNNLEQSGVQIPQIQVNVKTAIIDKAIVADFVLTANKVNQLAGKFRLDNYKKTTANSPIHGNLQIDFAQLKHIANGAEVFNRLSGALTGKINIAGQLSNPQFDGNIDLQNGHISLRTYGLYLNDINLHGGLAQQSLSVTGDFMAGKGKGSVTSRIDLFEHKPTVINLTGNELQIELPEYQLFFSPQLKFEYLPSKMSLTGDIKIPKAKIKPTDFSNVTTLPTETVIIRNNEKQAIPTNIALNVNIVLGSDVAISYENLHAMLQGKVTIIQTPGSLPVGLGEFYTTKGKYKAYGKNLEIVEGRIIYSGNLLTDPGLDIRATQKIEKVALADTSSRFDSANTSSTYLGSSTITLGVAVKGTVKKPIITLYSDPAGMSQTDIISYIVFGDSAANIKNPTDLAALSNVVTVMNNGKGITSNFLKKVRKTLGLSELTMGTTEYFDTSNPEAPSTATATTVNIKKKLGKHLTVGYKVGVFKPISIFQLRYQINKRLSIQSESSSADTGADLVYEIERD